MRFSFIEGEVIKVVTDYYSETDVYSSASIISDRNTIGSKSTEVCKTDVWIRCNEKDVCISLDQPFKALEGHKVTVSYEVGHEAPIQLINDSMGKSIWCSEAMRMKHSFEPKPLFTGLKNDTLFNKSFIDALLVMGLFILFASLVSFKAYVLIPLALIAYYYSAFLVSNKFTIPSSQKAIKYVSFGILIATPIVYVLFNGFLSLILFTGLILLAVILLRKFGEQNAYEPVIDEEITKINNLEWYVRARENHYKNDLR